MLHVLQNILCSKLRTSHNFTQTGFKYPLQKCGDIMPNSGSGNGNKRKTIGVIMSKPSKIFQTCLLSGIYKSAFEHDCNVVVFSTTNPRSDTLYHNGELAIFNLINYDKLAGVIYVPDTIIYHQRDSVITNRFLKAAKEKNIPAVTIDLKYEGVPCIACDDSPAIKRMVEHLIEEHECSDIAFMTGREGHPIAEARLNAFRESMEEHGLVIGTHREFYGDFWYNAGEDFVDFITDDGTPMPDAIVCAGGPMMESVYMALKKRGVRIPTDVKLGGFEEYVPRAPFLSTVDRQPSRVGKIACDSLFIMSKGKKIPKEMFVPCEISENYQLSCGCVQAEDFNILKLCGTDADMGDIYFSEYNTIRESLISKNNAEEMMWCLDNYTYFLKNFQGLYLCMCNDWNDPSGSLDDVSNHRGFTDKMVMFYKREYDAEGNPHTQVGNILTFESKDIFPLLDKSEGEPMAYVLRALHFEDRVFGYVAITFRDWKQTPNDNFDYWVNDVSNALESVRRLNHSRYLYVKVQQDAITDMMTGLYNRNGFNTMFPRMMEQAKRIGLDIAVAVGDLNNLKEVNDTYGHLEGDEMIKTAAKTISTVKIKGALSENNFRIGGDEFVKVIIGKFSENSDRKFEDDVTAYLKEYNRNSGKPYIVRVPVGVCICRAGETSTSDRLLTGADKLMYERKLRIKQEMGIKPVAR